MINLQDVTKRYRSSVALEPTSLVVERGQTTALIGPSGCGKSTILRLIMVLIAPTAGKIAIDGQEVTPSSLKGLRRKIGYVVQDGGLFPHLTARQNVRLMPDYLGVPTAESSRRLRDLCELTRFPADGLDKYPAQLSGGQRQRVSLMRALVMDPSLLLLDEPLGALDPLVRSTLQSDLKKIFHGLKKTVVLVTHDMGEAGYLGDTIVLMEAGRAVQKGSLEDLRERPANEFVAEFMSAQRGLIQL